MGIAENIAAKMPELKRLLYMANIEQTPEQYVKKKFNNALMLGICMAILSFFFLDKTGGPLILVPIIGVVFYKGALSVGLKEVKARITKRAKLIDKDVLFAGRFLLIKLNSGRPLVNAFEDATKGYGVANDYFKEILKDINLGTPLERALEKATMNSPSEKLKKILFQITNALKIGIDVTDFLEAILDEIADQQLIEIKRYGKKLNGITMFYMLFAVVMPSLGMTMIVVIASLLSISVNLTSFMVIVLGLVFVQFVFLTLFKSIRPNVDI